MRQRPLLLLTAMIILLGAGNVFAAAYLKFDGVDGETQAKGHEKWIEVTSFSASSLQIGQILIGLSKDGKQIPLTQDGRYSTTDGKMIIVINGKVSSVQQRAVPQQKMLTPGSTKGFNPQPDPPKTKQGIVTPGEAKGFNPQPEPPKTKRGISTPGETKGFNPQPEPPKTMPGAANQAQ